MFVREIPSPVQRYDSCLVHDDRLGVIVVAGLGSLADQKVVDSSSHVVVHIDFHAVLSVVSVGHQAGSLDGMPFRGRRV